MAEPAAWSSVARAEAGEANWDDDEWATAHFKAPSGPRSDHEPLLLFWRRLLIAVARRTHVCAAPAPLILHSCFSGHSLTPLALPVVLKEMLADGDLIPCSSLPDPAAGLARRLLTVAARLSGLLRPLPPLEEDLILFVPLAEERFVEIIAQLSEEPHWSSNRCVITMTKFQSFFAGAAEAAAVLNFLCYRGKMKYLAIADSHPLIEGVKLSHVKAAAPAAATDADRNALKLVWTLENLQRQLNVIIARCEECRKKALASFKSGNKPAAHRHVRRYKMLEESQDKLATLMERIEEVMGLISNAETSIKIYEVLEIGSKILKEQSVDINDVHNRLDELDNYAVSQKEVTAALESTPLQSLNIKDEADLEEEFRKLEAELSEEAPERIAPSIKKETDQRDPIQDSPSLLEETDSLCNKLSNMRMAMPS